MDAPGRLALTELKCRVEAAADDDERRGWCEALALDPRAGARRLGEQLARRMAAAAAEQVRIDALFERRRALRMRGLEHIAGVDEVGVGPLAGPVVSAAVVLPDRVDLPQLNDSKKLSPAAREILDGRIRDQALAIGIGCVSSEEIDRLNILHASLESMRRAVVSVMEQLRVDHVMVDARTIPGLRVPQTPLVHGDSIDGSIAAASIVAKVHRDGLMQKLDAQYPGYGFARHMGYGTAMHMDALRRLGASPEHRCSFAPVAAVLHG